MDLNKGQKKSKFKKFKKRNRGQKKHEELGAMSPKPMHTYANQQRRLTVDVGAKSPYPIVESVTKESHARRGGEPRTPERTAVSFVNETI